MTDLGDDDAHTLARALAEGLPAVYRDPVRYELLASMTAPFDLAFWRGLAAEHGGPVLELGAGTGRVALALAEAGHDVTGLDRSLALLEWARARARERGLSVTLAAGDLRDFELGRRYRLVIAPYHVFHHLLDRASIQAFFRQARQHLTDDGWLVVDAFQPSLAFLGGAPGERRQVLRYRDPYRDVEVRLFEENHYDPATQVNRIVWSYEVAGEPDPERDELTMRIVFPQELDALFELGGFTIVHKWGNYDRTPFGSSSPKQLVVARPLAAAVVPA
ncbi:MAG: class I SAM-dependent methyltransferase [Polyangiaceae bacterium]|nr:class I SAM-dependent methyltransferase [Polyangiaceae bacterium]